MKNEGVPVLASVAAILRPTCPDFPMPVTTMRAVQSSTHSTARLNSSSTFSVSFFTAAASSASVSFAFSRITSRFIRRSPFPFDCKSTKKSTSLLYTAREILGRARKKLPNLSGDSATFGLLFVFSIPRLVLVCRTDRKFLHSCRSTVVRRKRNKKSAAAAIPTGYVTSVERPKPSFACRMYVTVTADMKVAGIMPMM